MKGEKGFLEALRQELVECQQTGEMVEFHRWDDDPSIFVVGTVLEIDKDGVITRDFDPQGLVEPDLNPISLKSIAGIARNTEYLQRLQLLHDHQGQEFAEGQKREKATKRADVKAMLERAMRDHRVVTIQGPDDKIHALVRRCGDGFVLLEELDELGRLDGTSLWRFRQIKTVWMLGTTEQAVEFARRAYGFDKGASVGIS
jgi:hypothetical protein